MYMNHRHIMANSDEYEKAVSEFIEKYKSSDMK